MENVQGVNYLEEIAYATSMELATTTELSLKQQSEEMVFTSLSLTLTFFQSQAYIHNSLLPPHPAPTHILLERTCLFSSDASRNSQDFLFPPFAQARGGKQETGAAGSSPQVLYKNPGVLLMEVWKKGCSYPLASLPLRWRGLEVQAKATLSEGQSMSLSCSS